MMRGIQGRTRTWTRAREKNPCPGTPKNKAGGVVGQWKEEVVMSKEKQVKQVICKYCGMPASKVLVDVIESEIAIATLGFEYQYEIHCTNLYCGSIYLEN